MMLIAFSYSCRNDYISKDKLSNFELLFVRNIKASVSGTAVKGIMKNASVTISPISKDGSCSSSVISSGTTDDTGNYSLNYIKTGSAVCLTVSGHTNGKTTVFDEKTNSDISVASSSSLKLVSVLPESRLQNNTRKNMLASPFSRLISQRLQALVKEAGSSADIDKLYKKASKEAVIRFGLSSGLSVSSGKSFTDTKAAAVSATDYPELDDIEIDLKKPDSPLTAKYLSVLAGFSYLANQTKTESKPSASDIDKVITAFASDFEDGLFDGKTSDGKPITVGAGSSQVTFSSTPLTTVLLPAIVNYVQEGGKISAGLPNTSAPAMTAAQVTAQTEFIDNKPIVADGDVGITDFSFTASVNELNQTYTGTVSGTNITVTLPYGKTVNAVPSIVTNAASVTVNGNAFTSGVTALDFTNPVSFVLKNSAGASATYTVTATIIAPVEDTGQLSCYDNSASQVCGTVSATFPKQDAMMLNVPVAKGLQTSTVNTIYPNDYITKNTLTGIVWKTCAEGKSGSTCATGTASSLNYAGAVAACSALNTVNGGAGYAGLKNWRLPTGQEFVQVQNYNTASVYWDTTYFPGAANSDLWASNILLPSGTFGTVIDSSFNGVPTVQAASSSYAVRCVSGSPFPAPSLADNGDGTILDKRTGLIWQKCAYGQANDATCSTVPTPITWANALLTCSSLSLAGKSWRLPNIAELSSIIDTVTKTAPPYVNSVFAGFPEGGQIRNFHSSTTAVYNTMYNFKVEYHTPKGVTADTKNNTVVTSNDYLSRCVSGP
ncbi:MAG TPA: DUF1566 domain-containing protein [Leptospiraceae bacterium]|nr:DUF1566 domain-containing protein [Leptospiraceae bacterium]